MTADEKHGWKPGDVSALSHRARAFKLLPKRRSIWKRFRQNERTIFSGKRLSLARTDGETAFGVYLHWPFCLAKCPYCDFNSHVRHKPVDQARFTQNFLTEMATLRARTGPRTVTSIFLGGGTPSLMLPETVGALLDGIASHWSVAPDIEVTLEANPTSVEADRFRGYRAAGVNRVSLGIQALNDPDLRRLGRMHSVEEAKAAIRLARGIFPRLSFDLIYARPDQTIAAWREELKEAIGLAADHLSLYQLTIEEGTQFYNLWKAGKLTTPEPDHAAALYEETQRVTAEHGLPAYEISNHARRGVNRSTIWSTGAMGNMSVLGRARTGALSKTMCARLP